MKLGRKLTIVGTFDSGLSVIRTAERSGFKARYLPRRNGGAYVFVTYAMGSLPIVFKTSW
jgi:hypothetical protein